MKKQNTPRPSRPPHARGRRWCVWVERAWLTSPNAWLTVLPTRGSHALGKRFVAGFLATRGFDVERCACDGADRLVNGARAALMFSTLESGSYKFQQLRDQNYAFALCLGISPFDAHCWVIPKRVVLAQWGKGRGLESQHAGKAGSDTAWLTVVPGNEPAWLRQCGGRLADAAALVAKTTGRKPLP